jgi:hypothetical protein
MPNKVNLLGDAKKAAAISLVKDLLIKNAFADDVATWFCSNIETMDDQSLQLIEYLNTAVAKGSLAYDCQLIINAMTYLKVVSIGSDDFEGFTMIVAMMNEMSAFI